MGLKPGCFLVVPRFVALLIMLPLSTIFADVVSIAGGAWIAQTYAHISYDSYLASVRQTIDFPDVVEGLLEGRLWSDHRDRRRLPRSRRAAARPASQNDGTRSRGHLDHSDHVELSTLRRPLRLMVHGNGKAIARIENALLVFGDKVVLKNCSLDIMEGAITCIIGLSGAEVDQHRVAIDDCRFPTVGTSTCTARTSAT